MEKLLSSTNLENAYITKALQGDYSFVDSLTNYDLNDIYDNVKHLAFKEDIVEALFQAFHIKKPFFTFQLVYPLEKYKDFILHFLFHNSLSSYDLGCCVEKLFQTSYTWFYPLLCQNIEEIAKLGEKSIIYLLQMAYNLNEEEVIKKLVLSLFALLV